jgi:hypothetical protein
VESDSSNVLVGAILRKTLCTLLKHKAFLPGTGATSPTSSAVAASLHHVPLVDWTALESIHPHYPDLDELNLSDEDR